MKTQIMKLIDSHGVDSEATADKIMAVVEQNRCEVVDKIEKTQSEFVAFFEACESFEGANLVIELLEDLTKIKSLLQTGDICKACDSVLVDDQASCDSCGADICDNCEVVDNVNHTGNFCQKCCTAKNDGEG